MNGLLAIGHKNSRDGKNECESSEFLGNIPRDRKIESKIEETMHVET